MSRREKLGQCRHFVESMPSVSHEWISKPALAISGKIEDHRNLPFIESYRERSAIQSHSRVGCGVTFFPEGLDVG
jgi:hypothetical protein